MRKSKVLENLWMTLGIKVVAWIVFGFWFLAKWEGTDTTTYGILPLWFELIGLSTLMAGMGLALVSIWWE